MFKTVILLVDDAKIFLDVQKDFLKYSPVQIVTAYNGFEALESARQSKPDLIVMDVGMPHLDGVSCCRAIKTEPTFDSIPVVLISTNSGHDDIVSYQNAGCSAILHKPIQRREFLNTLYGFLPIIERREPRIPHRMPVTIETDAGTYNGLGHDISLNGIFVETTHDMKSEHEIVLRFMLPPGNGTTIIARGRIAWRNNTAGPAGNGLPRGFGVEFLEITGEDGTIAGYNNLVSFMMMHKAF